MPRSILLTDTPQPSTPLLTLLESHLPHSLPVLRRLQFALKFPGGSTPHTHVLYARNDDDDNNGEEQQQKNGEGAGERRGTRKGHFAAACVDLSRAPETEVWVYSTLEDGVNRRRDGSGVGLGVRERSGVNGDRGHEGDEMGKEEEEEEEEKEEEKESMDLMLAVLRRIGRIAAATESRRKEDGAGMKVLIGSLHETVRQGLLARGVEMDKSANIGPELEWEFCGKWLFRVEELPVAGDEGLPEGMRWDRVMKADVETIRARSSINRQEATLLMLPSTVVRVDDGTPVAWGFMGLDGTIMTVHVEEPYRRLGLAKALACKLMREHLPKYGDDGWGAADVFVENHKSQAMCRSVGGRVGWTLSWAVVDLASVTAIHM